MFDLSQAKDRTLAMGGPSSQVTSSTSSEHQTQLPKERDLGGLAKSLTKKPTVRGSSGFDFEIPEQCFVFVTKIRDTYSIT